VILREFYAERISDLEFIGDKKRFKARKEQFIIHVFVARDLKILKSLLLVALTLVRQT